MLLSKVTDAVREPINYQREFNNDVSKPAAVHPWLEKGQRVALVALPFISQYKPLGFLITSTMGTARVWTSSSQLIESISQGNAKEASYHTLQTTIAALSLASTFFVHPLGMILSTGQDLIIEAAKLNRHLRDGEYQKAIESCLKIINNTVYLGLFLHGGVELTIASLAMQIVLGIYQAQAEFRNGRYLEGSGQLLMVVTRGTQLAGQVKVLQMKLGIEKLIHKAETKKDTSVETPLQSGEKKHTFALKNSTSLAVESGKGPTEKSTNSDLDQTELAETILRYGRNDKGWTSLVHAVLSGDVRAVTVLLNNRADSNQRSARLIDSVVLQDPYNHSGRQNFIPTHLGSDGLSPLNAIAKSESIEIAELLLAKGADATILRVVGWTQEKHEGFKSPLGSSSPIYLALCKHNYALLEIFSKYQADFNKLCFKWDKGEKTPLQVAIEQNDQKAVEILIKGGARP